MPPANLEATVIILDIGITASEKDKNEPISFFEMACSCIMRIVERKIFSRPLDLVGLVLLGSKETNNDRSEDGRFQNISIATHLENPTWKIIEILKNKVKTTQYQADWLHALIVGGSYLKDELNGKKTSRKKVVLMSDLKKFPQDSSDGLQEVTSMFKKDELELIVIGPDIWADEENSEPMNIYAEKSEEQLQSEDLLKKVISETDGIACTFEEAISQLLFHKKKATAPQAWNVNLSIGPDINIPISGYGRIRDDKSAIKFKKAFKKQEDGVTTLKSIIAEKMYYKKDDNTAIVDDLDVIAGYMYGQTIVPYSKLDKAMEYESGLRCLKVYGFTKKENIHWNDITGDGLTYIDSKKDVTNSKSAIDALVTSMDKLRLVAIARRVYNKNNAPHMVVLFPIIEDEFKYLSMAGLAFKEDYKHMIFPPLSQKKFLPNEKQINAVDSLIKSMDLTQVDEDGSEVFLPEKTVNPALQHTLDTIAHRALYPNEPIPLPRLEVLQMIEVPPLLSKLSKEPLEQIKENFQLIPKEKDKSGKRWINNKLKSDDKPVETDDMLQTTSPVTASSVMTGQITKVGTVQPAKDFAELLSAGEPLDMVCEQLFEVVEKLVLLAFGDDYAKPIEAVKVMRTECVLNNPNIYNNWMLLFKCVLLERSKNSFFQLLLDNKLGLITGNENESSNATPSDLQKFSSLMTDVSVSEFNAMDTSEIDDLFDF